MIYNSLTKPRPKYYVAMSRRLLLAYMLPGLRLLQLKKSARAALQTIN